MKICIRKATVSDTVLIADIAARTFIESHGRSAAKKDIDSYVSKKYSLNIIEQELEDDKNICHIIFWDAEPAGFSKIIFNSPYPKISDNNVTKLERLYLLKEFYDLKLGLKLFKFNVELSKENNQAGIWLYVWKENERAIKFYERTGFEIIDSGYFKISETHSNPNYIMFLKY